MHDSPPPPPARPAAPSLRIVLDSLFAFVSVLDAEGRVVDVNQPALDAAGITLDHVRGKPLWECPWWAYDARVQNELRVACVRAIAGRASRYDVDLRVARGRLMTVDFTLRPLPDASGLVTHFVASGVDVTERKRSEEELRVSTRLLQAVVEQSGDLMCVKDRSGRMMMANTATLEALGKCAREVIGYTEADFLADQALAARMMEEDRRIIAGGKPETVEISMPGWGEERIWLATKTPYRDSAGNVLGLIMVARDITERHRAEGGRTRLLDTLSETAAVAERRTAQLEATVRAMGEGLLFFDMEGNVTLVNAAVARMFGLPDESALQRDLRHFQAQAELRDMAGTLVPAPEWPASRVLRGEVLSDVELRVRRRNGGGEEYIINFSGRPVHDEDGRQVQGVLVMRDVTAARRAEHALRASEEGARMRAGELEKTLERMRRADAERALAVDVLEHGEAVYVLDSQFRYVLVNEKHERLSGTSRREMLGRVIWEVFPEAADPQSRFGSEFRRAMRDRVPSQFEEYYAPFRMWALVSVFPIQDNAIAVFMQDISERRRDEDALRHADQQKDAFIAMLSHELRNPLSPIVVATHILQSRNFQDTVSRGAVEILIRQSRQMGRLLDDLLDVARITRNRLQLQVEVVDMVQCVQDAVHSSQQLIGEKSHELMLHLPSEPVLLRGDPVRLTQVVTNLLNNAAKYCPPNSRIDVSLQTRSRDLVLSVLDNGPGIRPEQLPHIFTAFYTTAATGHPRQGLGIGLWLTHRLVEMHAGSISAANEPGSGARFTVTLPAK